MVLTFKVGTFNSDIWPAETEPSVEHCVSHTASQAPWAQAVPQRGVAGQLHQPPASSDSSELTAAN